MGEPGNPRVLIFDPGSQSFIEAGYNEAGEFYGENYAFTAGQGNLGLVIYSKEDTVVVFSSVYSPAWNLKQGINLVEFPIQSQGLRHQISLIVLAEKWW